MSPTPSHQQCARLQTITQSIQWHIIQVDTFNAGAVISTRKHQSSLMSVNASECLLVQTTAQRLSFRPMPHLGWALHETWRCKRFVLFRRKRLNPEVKLTAAVSQACAVVSAQDRAHEEHMQLHCRSHESVITSLMHRHFAPLA